MSEAERAKEVAQGVVQRHFPQWNSNVDGTDESLAYPLARSLTAAFTMALNSYAAEQTAALREENARLRGALEDCVNGWTKGEDVWGPMQRAGALLADPEGH